MSTAWVNFARTVSPNQDDLPDWPACAAETRATIYFNVSREARYDPEGQGHPEALTLFRQMSTAFGLS